MFTPTAGQYASIASRAVTVSYISMTWPLVMGNFGNEPVKSCGRQQEGFEERLEVDNGDGSFVPYYVIVMRKVASRKSYDTL